MSFKTKTLADTLFLAYFLSPSYVICKILIPLFKSQTCIVAVPFTISPAIILPETLTLIKPVASTGKRTVKIASSPILIVLFNLILIEGLINILPLSTDPSTLTDSYLSSPEYVIEILSSSLTLTGNTAVPLTTSTV